MTTNELWAKFVEWMKSREGYPFAGQFVNTMWTAYQAAHASRDAEVEALKKRVRNVVRQMKDCASDVRKTPSLTGQWVADTINWFADEIGIDAAMREGE